MNYLEYSKQNLRTDIFEVIKSDRRLCKLLEGGEFKTEGFKRPLEYLITRCYMLCSSVNDGYFISLVNKPEKDLIKENIKTRIKNFRI